MEFMFLLLIIFGVFLLVIFIAGSELDERVKKLESVHFSEDTLEKEIQKAYNLTNDVVQDIFDMVLEEAHQSYLGSIDKGLSEAERENESHRFRNYHEMADFIKFMHMPKSYKDFKEWYMTKGDYLDCVGQSEAHKQAHESQ